MQSFLQTLALRHRRENLKKCSLKGLEIRQDMRFFTYPCDALPDLSNHLLLVVDGAPELCAADGHFGLLILDSTWRYLPKLIQYVDGHKLMKKRSLPPGYRTAYPRRQEDCTDPTKGLSSLEAIFIAYHVLGRDTSGLLDNYYWKEEFLKVNQQIFSMKNL